jgi:hypothetical protein
MIRMSRGAHEIYSMGDWEKYAPPKGKESHWEDGRSAKELARAWCSEAGIQPPAEFVGLLESHPYFRDTDLEQGFPEERIRFDRYQGEPRNADLNIAGRNGGKTVAVSVEGKADESFGSSIAATLAAVERRRAKGERTNGEARITDLLDALLPAVARRSDQVGRLPYQLFTAVAGVLAWAKRLEADAALLIVHEFVEGRRTDGRAATSEGKIARNGKALDSFLTLIGGSNVTLTPGIILGPFHVAGNAFIPRDTPLYVGKARRTPAPAGA